MNTKNLRNIPFLCGIVKIPHDSVLGTFTQIRVDDKFTCNIYELKGKHEVMKININDLVDKSFEGSCTVEVYDSYQYSCKSTILFVK